MNRFFKNAGADIPASIVVFLVALPLCLGIALGSNAPNLFAGLIGGIVGGIVIGSLSGSQLSVSGPAAGLIAIVSAAITGMPSYQVFLVAVVLAGVFQLLFGFLKAGFLGDYIPNSVIKGMLAAIGLILILKEIPHLLGSDFDFSGDESFVQKDKKNTFSEIWYALNHITIVALCIGLLGIGIQVLWEKILVKKFSVLKLVPAPLIVVIAGGLINYLAGGASGSALVKEHLVNIPAAASLQEFSSFFTMPDWGHIFNKQVWITAITIAIVASLETLLSIEAADKIDPLKRVTDNNRELKAQGVGNIVSGLIGGLPLTSVIVRTSANVNAGARTKLSAILHGILLLLSVAFFPGLLSKIPYAALAAILIYTGYKLAKVELFKEFYKRGWDQFIPFAVTILAILFTDLLKGIVIGLVVGLYFVMRSNFKSAVFVVNDHNKYLFRFRKDVSFLNKPIVKRKLEEVPNNAYVLIDTTRADFIDKDIIDTINEFTEYAPLKNITVDIKKSLYKPMHELISTSKQNSETTASDMAH
jgi:MFS superfamily sulfate permease-like transporter